MTTFASHRNTFPKSERLYLKNEIDKLFDKGKSFMAFPLRIVFFSEPVENTEKSDISIMVSVSKKRMKHAVDRNRIKRLIRENFRLKKYELSNKIKKESLHIAFLFVGTEMPEYKDIEHSIKCVISTISKRLCNSTTPINTEK